MDFIFKWSVLMIVAFSIFSCSPKQSKKLNFEVQGHRGCRGLMPENTLPAFHKAIELGVNTLELDVVVSKDKKVIVSHEAYFNHELTTLPDGTYLTKSNEQDYNIYTMNWDEIIKFDVGLKPHPRFPQQQKIKATKPLLEEVIQSCDSLTKKTILYNIEIKRKPALDEKFNPNVAEFIDLVVAVIEKNNLKHRATVQSFDHETIKILHQKYPDVKTVILIEDINSATSHLEKLGFTPYGYSPYFKLVNSDLVNFCRLHHMKLIPWTVNEYEDIQFIYDLKTDGIISDYPDRVLELIDKKIKK